jgi:hypothetical protein
MSQLSLLDYSNASKRLVAAPGQPRSYEGEYEAVLDIIEALEFRAGRDGIPKEEALAGIEKLLKDGHIYDSKRDGRYRSIE